VLLSGCDPIDIQHPTYAGTYALTRVEYRGYGTSRGWGTEAQNFPFPVQAPETVRLDQRGFRRSGGTNHITIAIYSDHGLLYSNDSEAEQKLLSQPMGWTDTQSDYLGINLGYACRWKMRAGLHFDISPGADIFEKIYPSCIPHGDLCITPQQWTDLPIHLEEAQNVIPSFQLEMSAGMEVSGTGYSSACGKPASESKVRLTYEMIVPEDIGDPRLDSPEREDRFTGRLKESDYIAPTVFGLPESGLGFLEVFPH
jgi:hypothetical protein